MKRILAFVVATVIVFGAMFTMIACTPAEEAAATVTGIGITTAPTKTAYVLGETFDPAGMVISKLFSNDTSEKIASTEYTYSPSGALKLSDKKITVTWTDTGNTAHQCSQNITVTNDVALVEIITNPTKMEYIVGEQFAPSGMTIQATLEDGVKEEVITVTAESVEYKTTALTKSDSHFAMNYGGCTFYLDMSVSYGAFMEAEGGLSVVAGVSVTDDGPCYNAIEQDLVDGPDVSNGGFRGINIGSPRVPLKNYVIDHREWTETTGGYAYGSGRQAANHIEGKSGGKIMYSLSGDKSGKANMIFKMANPNISGSVATEIKLNELIKIEANGTNVTIPDGVVLEAVDWTEYKSYNRTTQEYDGDSCVPTFCWQNISVEIPFAGGGNNIIVEFIYSKAVKVDSISFNADTDEINLINDSVFEPSVISAVLKVEQINDEDRVLMGLIVDANSIGYTDDAIKTVLGLTQISGIENATNNWSVGEGKNDPWTNSVYNGGLGYGDTSLSYKNSMSYKISGLVEVEKITTGDYAGCFCIWFDVTIPVDTKLGTTPEHNRYVGAWRLYNLNYGAVFANSQPEEAILRDGTDVTAEVGDFCYQIYCDIRDDNNSFGGGNVMLIVQTGSFEGEDARNLLGRRRLAHIPDNDPIPGEN